MDRARIAVTQYKARDVESFEEFAEHVAWHAKGAVWQGADCVVFPEYFTSELLTTFPEASSTPHQEAERIFDQMGRQYKEAYLDLFKGLARDHRETEPETTQRSSITDGCVGDIAQPSSYSYSTKRPELAFSAVL